MTRRSPVSLLLAAALALFGALYFYLNLRIILYPHQGELREGAHLFFTQLLAQGTNPYALETGPVGTNVQGLLFNLVVAPFTWLFGPVLWLPRLFSAGFILGAAFLLLDLARKLKAPPLLAIALALNFWMELFSPMTNGALLARADSPAIFLLVLGIWLPVTRFFSRRSLCLSAALAVLAYYAKPYALFGFGSLCAWVFLFRSRRTALLAFGAWLLFFTVALALTQWIAPLFLSFTFFANISLPLTDKFWASYQFSLFRQSLPLVLGVAAFSTLSLFKNFSLEKFRQAARSPEGFFLFSTLFASLVVYTFLGRHSGSRLAYLVHLISPFLLLFIAAAASRLAPKTVTFILVLLIANLGWYTSRFVLFPDFKRGERSWSRMESLVESSRFPLNHPALTTLFLRHGKPIFDTGLSEYYTAGAIRPGIFGKFFPERTDMLARHAAYLREVQDGISEGRYDRLFLGEIPPYVDQAALHRNYQRLEEIPLHQALSDQTWAITVYENRRTPVF